jgi:hypothetical protein
MRWLILLILTLSASPLFAQTSTPTPDPFAPIHILYGTWDAKADGPSGVKAFGTYTFRPELAGHIVARRGEGLSDCSGPKSFDCDHGDMLYVYPEGPALKAIYFDNEGHTIHYSVTAPTPSTVEFLSEPTPGPRFRLTYTLKDGIMTGRFQMQPPGSTDWHSYLEWYGAKK